MPITRYTRNKVAAVAILAIACGHRESREAVPRGSLPSAGASATATVAPSAPATVATSAQHDRAPVGLPKSGIPVADAAAALARLQQALRDRDAKQFAEEVRFPVRVQVLDGKLVRRFLSREDFLARFDAIVSPCVRNTISGCTVADFEDHDLGLSLPYGRLWLMRGPDGQLKVTTINNGYNPACDPSKPMCCPEGAW